MSTAYLIDQEDMDRLRELVSRLRSFEGTWLDAFRDAAGVDHILSRTIEIDWPDKPAGGPKQCRKIVTVKAEVS